MQGLFRSTDRDIRRIMRENLKKSRIKRMDSEWADRWLEVLA